MSDLSSPARGVTAQQFFAAEVPGGTMTAAHRATSVAYSTIHRASKGLGVSVATARELEKWSRGLGAEVFISAAATLDLAAGPDADDAEDPATADTIPPPARVA